MLEILDIDIIDVEVTDNQEDTKDKETIKQNCQ